MEDSLRVAPTSSSTNLTSQQKAPATITEETVTTASVTTAAIASSNNNQDKCDQQVLLASSRAETEKPHLRSDQKPPPFPPQHVSPTTGNRSISSDVTGGPASGTSNIGPGSFRKADSTSSTTSALSSGYVVKSHSNIHPPFGGNQRRSSIIAHVPPFNQSVNTASQSATKSTSPSSANSTSAASSLSSNNNSVSSAAQAHRNIASSAPITLKRPSFNSNCSVSESRSENDSISSLANERFGDSTLGNYLPPDAISVFHTLVSSAIDQCLKNSSDSKVRVSIFSNLYDSITKNNPASGAGTGGARSITSDDNSEKGVILLEAQKESELITSTGGKSSEMMEATKSASIPSGDRIMGKFPSKKNGFSSTTTFHTAIGMDEKKCSKIISELSASSEEDTNIASRLRIDEEANDVRKKRPSVLLCSDDLASKCRKNGSGDQTNSETNDVEASNSGGPPPTSASSSPQNNNSGASTAATGSSSGSCNEYKNGSNSSKLATVQASINYYNKESNVSAATAASTTAVEITSPKKAAAVEEEQEDEERQRRGEQEQQQVSSDSNNRSTPHHHYSHQKRSLSSELNTTTSQPDDYKSLASDNDDNDNDSEEVVITSAPSAAAAYAQKEQGENSVTSLRKLSENFFNTNNDAQQQQRARCKSNSSSSETPISDSNNAVEQLLASSSSSDMVNRLTKYLLEQHLFNGYSANANSGSGSMAEVGSNVETSKDVLGKLGFNSQTSELATAVASAAIAVMNSRVDQPRGYGSETANTGLFSGPYSTPSPKPIGVTPIQIMKDEPLNLTSALQQNQRPRKENSSSGDLDSTEVAASKESRPASCDLGNGSSTASPDIVVMDQADSASISDLKYKRLKSATSGGSDSNSRKGSFTSEDVVKDILSRNSASVTTCKDESASCASTPTSAQDGASVNTTKQASDSNPLLQNVANSALTGEDKNSFRRLCHNLIQSEILKLSNCEHAIEKKVVQHGVVGKVSLNNSNSINHQLSAALQKQVTSPESAAISHPVITIAKFLNSTSFPKGEALSNGGEEVKTIQPIPADATSSPPSQMEKQQFVLTSSAISNNSDFTLITEPSLPTYEQLTELSQDLHATLVAINPRTVVQKHQIRALTINCKRSPTAFTGLKMLVDCLKERLSDIAVTSSNATGPGSGGAQGHLSQLGGSSVINPGAPATASVLSSGAVSSKRKMSPMVSHASGIHDSSSSTASSLAASSPPSKIVKISSAESLPSLSFSRSYNNPQHSLMSSVAASSKLLNRPLAMSYPDEPPRLLAYSVAHNPPPDAAHLAAVVASSHSAVDSAGAAHLHHYRTPLASSTITSNSSGVSLTPGHAGTTGHPPPPHHPGTHAAAAAAAAAVASESAVALHARLAAAADYRAASSLLKHPSQHTPPHPAAALGSQTAAAVAAAAHSAYGNKLHAGGYIEGCPCALCVQNIEKHRAKVAHALIKSQQQQHGLGAHMSALSSATGAAAAAAIHHNSTAAVNSQPPPPHPSAGPPGGGPGAVGSVGVPPHHPHNHASDAAAVAAAAQYQSAAEHLRLYPAYPPTAHVPKLLQAPNATPAAPAGGHRSPILSSTPGVGLNKPPPHGATSNHFGGTSAHYPHVSPAAGPHELESQLHHSAAAAALGRFAPHLNSATPSSNPDPAAAILALHHESQLKAAAAAINAAALQQQHHQMPPNAHYGRHGHPSAAAAVAAAAAAAAQSGAVSGGSNAPGAPHSLPPSSTAAGGPPVPPGSGGTAAHPNTNHHSSPYSLALAAAAAANTSVSPMESSNTGGLNYASSNTTRHPNPLATGQFRSLDPQIPASTPKSMEFSGGPVSSTANSNSSGGAVKPAGSQCANCGGEAIYLCSGCRKIWYCSQECQVKAWERHYVDCFGAQVR